MATIIDLSRCLPLLIATLAEGNPDHPDQISDVSDTAVTRFLKWESDPQRRQVALDAALPRSLNQDIVAQLRPDDGADELFTWLKQKLFVRERTDGWAYHDVVRAQMLRHKRLTSPKSWADLHGKLADYYQAQCDALVLDENERYSDAIWQSHQLNKVYHRLCQSPQKQLPVALNKFLAALKNKRTFAQQWADVMAQAGKDSEMTAVEHWGSQLAGGLKAYNEGLYDISLAMFTALVNHPEIETRWRAIALAWRGVNHASMERYEEALEDFNQAIELAPEDDDWVIASRGVTYRLMERYEEALEDFNRAIELNPNDDWVVASRGVTYRLMERYEEALKDFSRAIELNPEDQWAIANRGQTYRLMKRDEEALQDLHRAIELEPEYDWAIAERGSTYQLMERYEEALKDFSRAIELDPEYDWAIAQRGETYRLMERYEEALSDFQRAIELNPEYDWAIASRVQTYRSMKRYEEALQDLHRAIELNPEVDWAIGARSELYLMSGRHQEALADCHRAITLDAENDWTLYIRGITFKALEDFLLAQPDFSNAIRMAQKGYEKDSKNWQNTFNLALYHLAAGNDKQAKHYYRDALHRQASCQTLQAAIQDLKDFLTVFPNHGLARQARQVLEKALQS